MTNNCLQSNVSYSENINFLLNPKLICLIVQAVVQTMLKNPLCFSCFVFFIITCILLTQMSKNLL